jgi:hypothetical protein
VFLKGDAKFSGGREVFSGNPSGWLGEAEVQRQFGDWTLTMGLQGLFVRSSGGLEIPGSYYEVDSQVEQTSIVPRITLSKVLVQTPVFLLEPSLALTGGYMQYFRTGRLQGVDMSRVAVPDEVMDLADRMRRVDPARAEALVAEARSRVVSGLRDSVESPVSETYGWVQPVLGLRAVVSPATWLDVWGYGGLGGLGWEGVEEVWEWSGGVRWRTYRGKVDVGLDLGVRGQGFSYESSGVRVSQQWYSPFIGGSISF